MSAGCSCYTTGSRIPGKMPARDCAGVGGALRPHILQREQTEEELWHLASWMAPSLLPRPQPLPCAGRKQFKSAPEVHYLFAPVLRLLFTCFASSLSLLCYSKRRQSTWMVVATAALLCSSSGYPLFGIGKGIFSDPCQAAAAQTKGQLSHQYQ